MVASSATTNRVRVTAVQEATIGTTPASPRMRTARITGESLKFKPSYVTSDQIRPDRMNADPILTMQDAEGDMKFELAFPTEGKPDSLFLQSAFYCPWVKTPYRFNDGTAGSQITGVAATGNIVTVLTAATGGTQYLASATQNTNAAATLTGTLDNTGTFAVGHLVQQSGYGQAANNGIFAVTAASATTYTCGGATFANEASPAAAARSEVVGFIGTSGDIQATATGLSSAVLNFTTLGLSVGQFIKIGGTGSTNRFATAANNTWVRVNAIAANALTLDNLPSTWATDTGTGVTLKVWFGDNLRNGVFKISATIEKGFLDQGTPTYLVVNGMVVDQLQVQAASGQKITGTYTYKGMGGSESTTTLSATPDAADTTAVMASNANVGRVSVGGAQLVGPNFVKELDFTLANNTRQIDSVGFLNPQDVHAGENAITGTLNTYFGAATQLSLYYAGTPTSVSAVITKNSQALVWQLPRITYTSNGDPVASAKNQDVMASFQFQGSIDTLTNAQVLLDRFPYYET